MAELLNQAIDVVDSVADRVTDWSRPSPCEGWTASDVLGHLIGTLDKVRVLLSAGAYAGRPATPAGLPGAEALAAWRATRDSLRPLLSGLDLDRIVQTHFGERTLGVALSRPTADLCSHAWDIAASQGEHLELPAHLLAVVRQVVDAVPPDALRRPGLFGPAVESAPDAGPTDQLMAWLGRKAPAAEVAS